MSEYDDHVDYLAATWNIASVRNDAPVWYILEGDELKGVIQQGEADTWQYRRTAEANYPGCTAWTKNTLGWCYMRVDNMRYAIWVPGTPPPVVLMAGLLEI